MRRQQCESAESETNPVEVRILSRHYLVSRLMISVFNCPSQSITWSSLRLFSKNGDSTRSGRVSLWEQGSVGSCSKAPPRATSERISQNQNCFHTGAQPTSSNNE